MKQTLLLLLASGIPFVIGCGRGTTRGVTSGTATVSGTLTQPNGDPLPGALVYVEKEGSGSGLVVKSKKRLEDDEGETCEDVPSEVAAVASDCTSAKGSYNFSIPECGDITFADGKITVNYRLGALVGSFSVEISCGGESNDEGATTVSDALKDITIAVCSGAYDRMENVLARMGFAPSDTNSDGTADMNGYGGSQTESFNFFRGHTDVATGYPNCCSLLKGSSVPITDQNGSAVNDSQGKAITRSLGDYDIVFVNCGNGCEAGGLTTVIDDILSLELMDDLQLKGQAETSALKSYVEGGGALYVTDLSYDFVEQLFPGQIDFKDGGSGTSAESQNAAQDGESGAANFEPLAADVEQEDLKAYLAQVKAGNTECGTPTGEGALNLDKTVNLCDFLSAWAVMIGTEQSSTATVWIRGAAKFTGSDTTASGTSVTSGTTKIPLTVSFKGGDGAVLYTSYHTDNSSALTAEFLPQERILQFLILETFGAIE